MEKLITDQPESFEEKQQNAVYMRDGEVWLREAGDNGGDMSLRDACAEYCSMNCDHDVFDVPVEEFTAAIDCEGCTVPWLYFVATGAAQLREQLRKYENIDNEKALPE